MGNRDRLPFSLPNLEGEIAMSQKITRTVAFGAMNSPHGNAKCEALFEIC
jgi:hypothetical protein